MKKSLLLSLLFLLLTSCSYLQKSKNSIGGRDTAYLKAKSVPPLVIPSGLSSSSIHEEYPVPNKTYPPINQKITLIPPDIN